MLWALPAWVLWMVTGPAVGVSASPRVGFAPATVTVKLTLDPAHSWRELCVTVLGPESHQSCWGSGLTRVTTKTFHLGSVGAYEVQGWGREADGATHQASTTVCLADAGENPCG